MLCSHSACAQPFPTLATPLTLISVIIVGAQHHIRRRDLVPIVTRISTIIQATDSHRYSGLSTGDLAQPYTTVRRGLVASKYV